MAKINLLPWREELRKERQRQFLSIMGLVLMLGVVVLFAYMYTVGLKIDAQLQRNDFLKSEIAKLESQINEIKKLESERQLLVERMEMIAELQQSRPKIVRLFDEMVKSVPEGLTLKTVKRDDSGFTIEGSAESAQRVTAFMRSIEQSKWFSNAHLKDISDDVSYGGRRAFLMTVKEGEIDKEKNKAEKPAKTGGVKK